MWFVGLCRCGAGFVTCFEVDLAIGSRGLEQHVVEEFEALEYRVCESGGGSRGLRCLVAHPEFVTRRSRT